ncbi:DUF2190 family protein [Acuticoccus mangrovi]|uniref:DUF2190 family protein n=1 Tax=Acuticoccus mangrovi TaxID=2796142 RepID=A0A934ILY1_9HYPH|nr:DUF2190 family protein [Acuticoccus mangrovi]MBJ3774345.1 DUF2190 family protein [Acuticoccus mangrovi]
MKNYVHRGDTVTLPAPAGGATSGDGVLVGTVFGVAAFDAPEGEEVECTLVGIFELPKAAGAVTAGAKVYWSTANGNVTTTASGNSLIGAAIAARQSGDATVKVRLNGITI